MDPPALQLPPELQEREETSASPPALSDSRAGHLLGLAPGAARLVDDEGLVMARGVVVVPACAAVAGRAAGERVDHGIPAGVE